MSKEAEARVRDELLQDLYRRALRCTLADAASPARARVSVCEGTAAGLSANLRPADLLLLPRRGANAFRVLRGLPGESSVHTRLRERAAGVLPLPNDEAAAVNLALGAAFAAHHAGAGAVVCVVLTSDVSMTKPEAALKTGEAAGSWGQAAHQAARLGLPLMLVTDRGARSGNGAARGKADPRQPAPLFPSIPVDREDALAIYRVAYECTVRARAGGGPSHIECIPFHVRGQQPEPGTLARLEAALRKRGAFHKAWRRTLERELIREQAGDAQVTSH